MLRITISRSAKGASEYFTNALSKEDYFFTEKTVQAYWQGQTAQKLGLKGKAVSKSVFERLVNNIDPLTGKRLTVRNASSRRAGYEYTFNCPKSVSILMAITKDEAILKAHKAAVQAAMQAIEADMQTQANRNGQKFYDDTGNIIYAAFHHMTSRPVETIIDGKKTYIPDPTLHTHAFVPNVTYHEGKQRYQALEEGNIRRLAPYYEAIFHSVLSKGIKEAGYNIEKTHDRWEIKGITKTIRDKYSNRTLQIEEIARIKGITDAKTKSELGARTRIKKNKGVAENELYQLWKDRLTPKELRVIETAKGSSIGQATNITAKEAVDLALEHFSERQSAIPTKRVLGHALTLGYGILRPEDVKEELKGRENILYAEKQTIEYLTTREMVKAEESMLAYASQEKGLYVPLNPDYEIVGQDFLNDQQKSAINQLLNSSDGIQVMVGSAGVGKTTLLQNVKTGIEQAGKKLIAVAPSAEASRGVLRSKGFEGADTIAALLKNPELQQSLKGNVLLVDEAGMISTKTANELFQIAAKQGCRVLLSGDPVQHSAVQAGDSLRQLIEKSGIKPVTVNKIVRQKLEPYRQAVEQLAKGNTLQGFKRLDRTGAVKEIEDPEQRHEAIAKAYMESINQKQSCLVVSPTHAEIREVTNAIREKLKANGKITGPEILFDTQRSLSFTEAQKKDTANYEAGQIIQFHQNQRGFKAGGKYEVMPKEKDGFIKVRAIGEEASQKLPLEKTENYQVFQATQTALSTGDHIRITNNGKTKEGTKINNGQTYTVKGFTETGDIQLSNGKTLSREYRNLQYGYVHTSHASQGKDARHVIISQSALSYPASNEKQFYVSASRGVERISIYTDDKAELKHAILRSGERMSAKEVADQHYQRQRQRNRTDYYHSRINQTLEHGQRPESNKSQLKLSRDARPMDREH